MNTLSLMKISAAVSFYRQAKAASAFLKMRDSSIREQKENI